MKPEKAFLAILSIIAVALVGIAVRLWLPTPTPTYGDWLALRDIKDDATRQDAYKKLLHRLPVVRVQGGFVDASVTGEVSIER